MRSSRLIVATQTGGDATGQIESLGFGQCHRTLLGHGDTTVSVATGSTVVERQHSERRDWV
jgi:hypothetical protein